MLAGLIQLQIRQATGSQAMHSSGSEGTAGHCMQASAHHLPDTTYCRPAIFIQHRCGFDVSLTKKGVAPTTLVFMTVHYPMPQ